MSEIATYQCTNGRCRRALRLSKDFPVWKANTPLSARKLRVANEHASYIERYRSETFCGACKKTIELTPFTTCPHCGANDLPVEYTGVRCTDCKHGSFTLVHLAIH